jgi:two-component system OmpR family response regulator
VLLVDDEETMLALLEICLNRYDCLITRTMNGDEAIEALKRDDFDLVITDLQMRATSGLEVVKRAKELRPATLVFMITGCDDKKNAITAFHLGADDYLLKPLSFPLLMDRLRRKGFSPPERTVAGPGQQPKSRALSGCFTECKRV